MVGITLLNGFSLPIEQRFHKIKDAGFQSVLLWWGKEEAASRQRRVQLACEYGLQIENAHGTTDNLNALWTEGDWGESVLRELKKEIEDCAAFGVETLVLHLTNGDLPPPVSSVGISRIQQLVRLAESLSIHLAFENLRRPEHLRCVLDTFPSPYVGLCYDSGHEHLWSPDIDWLGEYGTRVSAIHLHDNRGDRDSHLVPFDGTIDWEKKAEQIAMSSYSGAVTLESEFHASEEYRPNGIEAFFSHAHAKGEKLAQMIQQSAQGEI